MVVDEGEIVEQGNHQSLIAAGGLYAELFRLQSSGYVEPSPLPGIAPEPPHDQPDHVVVIDGAEVP